MSYSLLSFLQNIQGLDFVFIFIALLLQFVGVVPFWFICKKAGFNPWLSLLILIPGINIVFLYAIAFSKWKPREKTENTETEV